MVQLLRKNQHTLDKADLVLNQKQFFHFYLPPQPCFYKMATNCLVEAIILHQEAKKIYQMKTDAHIYQYHHRAITYLF